MVSSEGLALYLLKKRNRARLLKLNLTQKSLALILPNGEQLSFKELKLEMKWLL